MRHTSAPDPPVGFPATASRTRHALLVVALLGLLLASGCGSTTGVGRRSKTPIFFPPLPNRPRVQFLASFTTAADIEESDSFAEFVLGGEQRTGELLKPYGAVLLDDRIVVADVAQKMLVVIDLAGREFRALRGNEGAGRARSPVNIAADEEGRIYVADSGRKQVLQYDKDERFLRAFGTKGQFRPTDVAVRGGEMFVCDIQDHEIEVLDLKNGALLHKFGGPGRDAGKLYFPTNIDIGPDGDIFVTETGNFRIQRFHPDGTSVKTFGKLGDSFGNFARPKGVSLDPEGRLYVADAAFENVQVFNPEGKLLMVFGGPGPEPGNMYLPAGIEVTTRGLERFKPFADKRLDLHYLIVVVSQYGPNKVSIYGFGDWTGEVPAAPPKPAGKESPKAESEAPAAPAAEDPGTPPAEIEKN